LKLSSFAVLQDTLAEQEASFLASSTANGLPKMTSQQMQQGMQNARKGLDLQGQGALAKYQVLAEHMKALMGNLEKQLSFSTAASLGLVDHLAFEVSKKR